jgi:hypothetical protein
LSSLQSGKKYKDMNLWEVFKHFENFT